MKRKLVYVVRSGTNLANAARKVNLEGSIAQWLAFVPTCPRLNSQHFQKNLRKMLLKQLAALLIRGKVGSIF